MGTPSKEVWADIQGWVKGRDLESDTAEVWLSKPALLC